MRLAAVEATTMEPAATVKRVTSPEAFTTMEVSAAVEALVPVKFTTAMPAVFPTESVATPETLMVTVPATAIVPAPTAVEAATTVEATEPRTCASKYSPCKIIRAVVAVRRACVRGIPIIAIRADRSRANVGRAKLNGNLCVGCPCHNHENPEQNSVL
jgi:hypothetical protein